MGYRLKYGVATSHTRVILNELQMTIMKAARGKAEISTTLLSGASREQLSDEPPKREASHDFSFSSAVTMLEKSLMAAQFQHR